MCEQVASEFEIDKAISRVTISLVDPKIWIVDIKFDEDNLIGDD